MPAKKNASVRPSVTADLTFKSVTDLATAMIDVWEYDARRYVYVSKAITYVSGYDSEELLKGGVDFTVSKMHPDDRDEAVRKNIEARKVIEYHKPGIDDSKPFVSFEYRVRHKNGGWVWLHSDASVYSRTPEGKLEYIISTTVNINEQKAFEAKLLKTTKRLEQSQSRLRKDHEQLMALSTAKEEFVSVASHQLRAPATAVKQYVGLLLQKFTGNLSEAQIEFLQAAYDSNERQLHIISELLSKAQIETGNIRLYKSKVDLNELIKSVVEESLIRRDARKQKLTFHSPDRASIVVEADEHLIRMILENLTDNASKYFPEGRDIDIRLYTDGNYATVDVEDNGFGISKEDRTKLFQKYSRINNAQTSNITGTGLGLYWAKQIVDLHGGSIHLKSSSKFGSTFSFTLPL